eukprot:TRINITY_DN12448_c0_g1_i20.p1 TRINITY_DN12448_c0_g1~~TRINITY_DN12448_c0_g1_i20.p1  ORF type:complete len:125 (+),score=14.87 TRINITY_DN12448_c0_g1_i20:77-451(+)
MTISRIIHDIYFLIIFHSITRLPLAPITVSTDPQLEATLSQRFAARYLAPAAAASRKPPSVPPGPPPRRRSKADKRSSNGSLIASLQARGIPSGAIPSLASRSPVAGIRPSKKPKLDDPRRRRR